MDERRSVLFSYSGRQPSLYRCTADPRTNSRANGYSAANFAYAGKKIPPARSISMNGAVGTVCRGFKASGSGHSGPPVFPVDGPWLSGHHQYAPSGWQTYGKITQVVAPSPDRLIVLLDENTLGLNDACFNFGMSTPEWIDFPGGDHGLAGTFAFADGHGEVHKWNDPRTRATTVARIPVPGSPDWLWMQERISARAQ